MGHRTWLNQLCSALMREGIQSSLVHKVWDIKIKGALLDFAFFDFAELAIAQHRYLARRPDAKPWSIEQAEQMSHRYDPDSTVILQRIETGKENILPALKSLQASFERQPKFGGHVFARL